MRVSVYCRGGVSTGPLTSLNKWGEMFRGAFALEDRLFPALARALGKARLQGWQALP